jgi:hypothetical protein
MSWMFSILMWGVPIPFGLLQTANSSLLIPIMTTFNLGLRGSLTQNVMFYFKILDDGQSPGS